MTFVDAFREAGWGVYPTVAFGVAMVWASVRYSVNPQRKDLPLIVSLGVMTLVSGALGFVTGLITTLRYVAEMQGEPLQLARITEQGIAESLQNIVFALVLILFGSMASGVAFLRRNRGSAA